MLFRSFTHLYTYSSSCESIYLPLLTISYGPQVATPTSVIFFKTMASPGIAALTANADGSSGVVDKTIASIDAADYYGVSSSDPNEKVKTFVDGVIASVEDDDVTPNADDDEGTTTASIEKAGLFPDVNDNSDLRFDAIKESVEAASLSSDFDKSAGVAMPKRKDRKSVV